MGPGTHLSTVRPPGGPRAGRPEKLPAAGPSPKPRAPIAAAGFLARAPHMELRPLQCASRVIDAGRSLPGLSQRFTGPLPAPLRVLLFRGCRGLPSPPPSPPPRPWPHIKLQAHVHCTERGLRHGFHQTSAPCGRGRRQKLKRVFGKSHHTTPSPYPFPPAVRGPAHHGSFSKDTGVPDPKPTLRNPSSPASAPASHNSPWRHMTFTGGHRGQAPYLL